MIKLNLTKEQVESMDTDLIVVDWLIMHAEIAWSEGLIKAIYTLVNDATMNIDDRIEKIVGIIEDNAYQVIKET